MIHRVDSLVPPSCGCPHRFCPCRVSLPSISSSPAMLGRVGPVISVSCRTLSCSCASWTALPCLIPSHRADDSSPSSALFFVRGGHAAPPPSARLNQRPKEELQTRWSTALSPSSSAEAAGAQRPMAPSCSRVAVHPPHEEERRQQEKHDADFLSLCLQGV